jgi:gamma-glutamyltranspeptidase/glutathione hydrolase
VAGPVAVVAAGHPESARAGAQVLAAGGNAVDAVCASAFAAAVAESPLTGPGAGGFLLARNPAGESTLLDFFVTVPGLGPGGRSLDPADLDSFTVPFGGAEQIFHIGPASVAVPGMLHGLVRAVERLGRLPLAEVVAPATHLARDGVAMTPETAYLHRILATMLAHTHESQEIFAPEGRVRQVGERFRIPDLADTFDEIVAAGCASLRTGAIAQRMLEHLVTRGGLVTATDLTSYEVVEREPLVVPHGDVTLITNPPPSSGGVLIAAALATIAPGMTAGTEGFYRAVAAAGVAANGLRGATFADRLHEPGFAAELLGRVSRKPTGTTHTSAVDREGGMASLSSSCGSGGGVVVPGTGILLNNMLGEDDLNPSGFGRLAPGIRMSSMMAPSLIVRDGMPLVALGSAGSNRLRSAILQTVVSIVDDGMSLAEAVARPRIHPEGDGIDVEGGVPDAAVAVLEADGHRLRRWDGLSLFFGGVSVAGHGPSGLSGAGDPRRGGAAFGVDATGMVSRL